MFKPITLIVPTIAVAKGRARIGKFGVYTPKKTMSFEAELRWHWEKSGHGMIPKCATTLRVTCDIPKPKTMKKGVTLPITRPDIDNYAKSIIDGLNGFAWEDDNQITDLLIAKRYAHDMPRIIIHILPTELRESA